MDWPDPAIVADHRIGDSMNEYDLNEVVPVVNLDFSTESVVSIIKTIFDGGRYGLDQ